jgi:hypothetical protein
LPGIHGPSVHDGLLPGVHGPSVHDGLLSGVYDGGGRALRLLTESLHHLVHHLLLIGMLLSSQANELELVFHFLPPGLSADGFASLKSSFQRLDNRRHSLDPSLHCRAHCAASTATAAAAHIQIRTI